MNYRANIVIFHEIAPLSARSSKKEDAKRGTGAREMAKTDRKTGGRRGCGSCISCSVRPRTAHFPRCAGAREAGGAHGAGPTEEQSGTIAEPPLRSFAQRRSVRKKEEQTTQALGIFSTYRGAFRRSPPPRPTPSPTQEARSEKPANKAHARTSPSFCFSPSPIGSNSVVHNALQVKISKNLTHKKHHATISGSTACG